jgi:hypothetical protein
MRNMHNVQIKTQGTPAVEKHCSNAIQVHVGIDRVAAGNTIRITEAYPVSAQTATREERVCA